MGGLGNASHLLLRCVQIFSAETVHAVTKTALHNVVVKVQAARVSQGGGSVQVPVQQSPLMILIYSQTPPRQKKMRQAASSQMW
jgi:hypothetical protein